MKASRRRLLAQFDLAAGSIDSGDKDWLGAESDLEIHAEGFELGAGISRVRVFSAESGEGTADRGAESWVFGLAPVDQEGNQGDAAVRTEAAPTAGGESPFEEVPVRADATHRLDGTRVDAEVAGSDDGGINIRSFD